MPKDENVTIKFKADISDLKSGISQANSNIKLANAQFKAASAGMDDWAKSSEGIKAKLSQLGATLNAEKTKLNAYKEQLDRIKEAESQNEKSAESLRLKYQQAAAAYGENSAEANKYKTQLSAVEKEILSNQTASEKLSVTILNQQAKISNTEKEYKNYEDRLGLVEQAEKEAERSGQDVSDVLAKIEKSSKGAGDGAKNASDGFTVMKGALADLVADGIKNAVSSLKDFAFESENALRSFQAQTGVSTEAMGKFQDQMNDLYKNNYGESLNDIGDKMAYIKQVTGETDPSKIKELTENVITLEDTFGSDFKESVRGVNNLMTHFGIDSTTAFDLFAKGSQVGLDYTEELGDNIAEYGGNFQQAGYSADEYFQLLANGSKNGAYNLDKVNDSINEVKNRLGDGTIKKNIDIFSEGTKETFSAWEKGEKTMKDVIDSIVGDINGCTNEQEALNMAATAFGTMGEDANLKVVKSLTSVGDQFKNVSGTMNEVKNIKYNTVESSLQSLGRTIKTDLLAPLVQSLIPVAQKVVSLFKWFVDNKAIVIGAVSGMLAAFAVVKIAAFATSFSGVISAFMSAPTIISGVTAAMKALNLTALANPYVALGAAIAAVVVALGAWIIASHEASQETKEAKEAAEAQTKAVEENKAAWDEMTKSRQESTNAGLNELSYYQSLYDELNTLVDANGKVKEGYEGRVSFITSELKNALGVEIETVDGVVNGYSDLVQSFDKVIEKKKAMIILEGQEETYKKAIKEKMNLLQSQGKLETEIADLVAQAKEKEQNIMGAAFKWEKAQLEEEAKNLYAAAVEKKKQYNIQLDQLEEYNTTIGIYEKNAALAHEERYNEMTTVDATYISNLETNQDRQKAILESQIQDEQRNLDMLLKQKQESNSNIYDEQIKASETRINQLKGDLQNYTSTIGTGNNEAALKWLEGIAAQLSAITGHQYEFKDAGNGQITTYIDGIESGTTSADMAWQSSLASQLTTITGKNIEFKDAGNGQIETYIDGVASGKLNANNTWNTSVTEQISTITGRKIEFKDAGGGQMKLYVDGVEANANSADRKWRDSVSSQLSTVTGKKYEFKDAGNGQVAMYINGVQAKEPTAEAEMRAFAENMVKKLDKKTEAQSAGGDIIDGVKSGVSNGSKQNGVFGVIANFASSIVSKFKSTLGIQSPSKVTREIGKFLLEGFGIGIKDEENGILNQISSFGKSVISSFNNSLNKKVNMSAVKANLESSLNNVHGRSMFNGQFNSSNTGVGNTINFYQTNNSPKSLSRLEIYRQTKNALNYAAR